MHRTLDRGLPPSAYTDYMRSPQWAAQRERWKAHRSRRQRRCQACGSRTYHLHHRTYVRLGREHLRDLVALCERHHDSLHALQRRTGWSLETTSRRYLGYCRVRRAATELLTTPAGWVVCAVLAVLLLR
jgi:ribosomal protein S14